MKKSKLLIAPLLVVPFLASCGGGSEEYKVSIPDTNGVIVTPNKATKGKEYVGTIKMAQDVDPDHILPDALDKVTSGNKELVATKDYTYTLKEDNLSADFKIPAANIVGDVSIQLTLRDKPKPTSQHALTFTGHDCELYLDSGYETKFVDGKYDEGPFKGYIKPSDGFDFPTDANVKLTSSGEDYDAYEYDDQTGVISFTVDADIDIEATSEEAVDPTVNAEEYDKALSMEGVDYLQLETFVNLPFLYSVGTKTRIVSPTVCHFVEDYSLSPTGDPSYDEKYVNKVNQDTYIKLTRDDKTILLEGKNWEDAADTDWTTPQEEGTIIKNALLEGGVEGYSSLEYDPTTKSYIHEVEPGSDVYVIIKFENKKLVYFDLAGMGEETISYEETTPELPFSPTAEPQVNEAEFDAAFAGTGIAYMQFTMITNSPEKSMVGTAIGQLSPTICYSKGDFSVYPPASDPYYIEGYTYKLNEDTYKIIERNDPETSWTGMTWKDGTKEEDWETPAEFLAGLNPGVPFSLYNYDSSSKSYTFSTSGHEIVLKFRDKKISYLKMNESITAGLSYKEFTPELPIPAPTL